MSALYLDDVGGIALYAALDGVSAIGIAIRAHHWGRGRLRKTPASQAKRVKAQGVGGGVARDLLYNDSFGHAKNSPARIAAEVLP